VDAFQAGLAGVQEIQNGLNGVLGEIFAATLLFIGGKNGRVLLDNWLSFFTNMSYQIQKYRYFKRSMTNYGCIVTGVKWKSCKKMNHLCSRNSSGESKVLL
jgi:hypothetical protein